MMRTPLARLELLEPRTVREALAMLESERDLTPFAGGTDLYVTLNAGTEKARRFIDLSRLAPLRRIALDHDTLVIGAMATYTQLRRAASVVRRLPMLCAASREVGGVQVQNRGTLGGNVGNASPAGDTLPVLAAAEAIVVLASRRGERRVPFDEFFTGYRRTVRRPDELIAAFEIPRVKGKQWFRKVGTRAAQAISKVVAAGVEHEGKVRFALGAVAPVVVRARKAEGILNEGGEVKAASAALVSEITPIDDVRSTRVYRQRVAANLLEAFCAEIRRD
jgi:xanthine dehydrogenase small subunit